MGKYNRKLFKVITIGMDVHRDLISLKRSPGESFSELIRRLISKYRSKEEELTFSFIRLVSAEVKEFYGSGLFG